MKIRFLLFLLGFSIFGFAQDSLLVPVDSVDIEVEVVDSGWSYFFLVMIFIMWMLFAFYEKSSIRAK